MHEHPPESMEGLRRNTHTKPRAIGRSFQVEDNLAQVLGRYLSPQSRLADLTRAQQDDAEVEPSR